jgi:hypothetical protein
MIAVIEVNINGIELILAAENKQRPIRNGIRVEAVATAASGSGLKSKY